MSGPNSNLRKSKKAPLPGKQPGQRSVPFRTTAADFLDNDDKILLEDVLGRPSTRQSTRSDVGHSPRAGILLPKLAGDSTDPKGPSDFQLMGSMMSRISQLELKVQYYAKEIIGKDKKIDILEEKAQLLSKLRDDPECETNRVKELEKKCESLQDVIKDMEDFLADYGMMWVGSAEETRAAGNVGNAYEELPPEDDSVWRPETSLAGHDQPTSLHIDFSKLIKSIQELNVLAGDGEKKIQHTMNGAILKARDPIPLTLYANGIFMFNGPFRSYEEPTTQRYVQDVMDGYFPSELQDRYPDGIPIQVSDKRDIMFKDARANRENFPGAGQTLGGDNKPSRLVPSNLDKSTATSPEINVTTSNEGQTLYESSQPPNKRDNMFKDARANRENFPGAGQTLGGDNKPSRLVPSNLDKSTATSPEINVTTSNEGQTLYESSQPPRPQLSVDQFLNKLPSSVMRDGKVIDVRSTIADSLTGDTSKVGVTVIETPVVQEIKDRLSSPRGTSRPLSSKCSITTLRIKSENGNHTYILKMRSIDTIADVRKHIDAQRSSEPDYDIVTTYPNKILSDDTATLVECELIPNAALIMRPKRK